MQDSIWKKSRQDHPLVGRVKDAVYYLLTAKNPNEVGVANKYLNVAIEDLETAAQKAPGQFTKVDAVSISHMIPAVDEKTPSDLVNYSERMCGVLAVLSKTGIVSNAIVKRVVGETSQAQKSDFYEGVASMFARVNPAIRPLREQARAESRQAKTANCNAC